MFLLAEGAGAGSGRSWHRANANNVYLARVLYCRLHVLGSVVYALALKSARDPGLLEQPRASALVALEEELEPREGDLANGPALGVIPLDTAGSGPKPIRERHVAAAQQRGRDVDPKAELPTLREVSLVSTRIRRNIEEERASNRVLILTGTGSRVLHSTAARN